MKKNKYGNIIEINDGIINVNGTKIGEVNQDLKHGYHPAVNLVIPNKNINEWFELDEENLIDKIFERVGKLYEHDLCDL